jgi:predicted acylesterase/phospholipase RssA
MDDFGLDARRADVVVGTSAGSIVAASVRRHSPPLPSPVGHRNRTGRRPAGLALLRGPDAV